MMTADFIASRAGIRDLRSDAVTICVPDALELERGAQMPRLRPARFPEMFGVRVVRNPDDACRHCLGSGTYQEPGRDYGDPVTCGPCPWCGGSGRK